MDRRKRAALELGAVTADAALRVRRLSLRSVAADHCIASEKGLRGSLLAAQKQDDIQQGGVSGQHGFSLFEAGPRRLAQFIAHYSVRRLHAPVMRSHDLAPRSSIM